MSDRPKATPAEVEAPVDDGAAVDPLVELATSPRLRLPQESGRPGLP